MLPEGPKTSENQMSLPTIPIQQTRLSPLMTNNVFLTNELQIDKIMPDIYYSNVAEFWSPEKLRAHGFTHIINIDRHIQKDIQNPITNYTSLNKLYDINDYNTSFKTLHLDFVEESYLTTVLPNCYKAVKFIDKALQNNGAILIIDRFNNQKCLTIVIGYLMYKNNINFNDAFQRVKKVFKKAELERFFISQLYEYEPILQVQRAQSCGHSCSRELRSAQLKRKKLHDDIHLSSDLNYNYQHQLIVNSNNIHSDNGDVLME